MPPPKPWGLSVHVAELLKTSHRVRSLFAAPPPLLHRFPTIVESKTEQSIRATGHPATMPVISRHFAERRPLGRDLRIVSGHPMTHAPGIPRLWRPNGIVTDRLPNRSLVARLAREGLRGIIALYDNPAFDPKVRGVPIRHVLCDNTVPLLSSVLPDFNRGGFLAASALQRMIDGSGASADEPIRYGVGRTMHTSRSA